MSKNLSLKLNDSVFEEKEKALKIERSKRTVLKKDLLRESKLVSEESMLVLHEFEVLPQRL